MREGRVRGTAFLASCGVVLVSAGLASAGCTLLISTNGYSGASEGASTGGAAADAGHVADAGSLPPVDGGDAGNVEGGAAHPPSASLWDGNGHAYEIVNVKDAITFEAARVAAAQRGGHLATITSRDEEDFVDALAVGEPAAFETDHSGGPWLGGVQTSTASEPAGGWGWITGEAWSFTQWGSTQPDNYEGKEDHLALALKGGVIWNDVVPDFVYAHAYVVEYE